MRHYTISLNCINICPATIGQLSASHYFHEHLGGLPRRCPPVTPKDQPSLLQNLFCKPSLLQSFLCKPCLLQCLVCKPFLLQKKTFCARARLGGASRTVTSVLVPSYQVRDGAMPIYTRQDLDQCMLLYKLDLGLCCSAIAKVWARE